MIFRLNHLALLFAAGSLIAATPAMGVVITLDANSNVSGTDPGVTLSGAWTVSTGSPDFLGTAYLHDGNSGGGKTATFTPTIPVAGNYLVEARWTADLNRASNAVYTVNFDSGNNPVTINQKVNGNVWTSLGVYNFAAGTLGNVVLSDTAANGFVIADGLRFSTFPPPAPPPVNSNDNFESYAPGSNLNGGGGGSGFASNWATTSTNVTVQPKTLIAPNGLSNGGTQAVRIQPALNITNDDNSIVARTFAPATSTVYVGMILRTESLETGDFINFQLSDGASGNNPQTLGFGIDISTRNFFTRVGDTSISGVTNQGSIVNNDQDYMVIAKFSLDSDGQYGRVDLFIDPTSIVEPGVATLTSIGTQPSLVQLTRFNIRVNSLETDDRIFFDQLRISDTFEGAIRSLAVEVPEPASLSLLALSSLAMLRRRRVA